MSLPILSESRCTGHCCKRFSLPASPSELVRLRDGALAYQHWYKRCVEEHRSLGAITEETRAAAPESVDLSIPQIYDMVRYLGYTPPGPSMVNDAGNSRHWYTCSNFKNGNCTIYATRPPMCSRFPNDSGCEYVDCTWVAVRFDQGEVLPQEAYINHGRARTVDEVYADLHGITLSEYLHCRNESQQHQGETDA